MRLPEFRPGDVIKFRGRIIQIRSSGKKVHGISLEDGSRFISTPEELKGAEKIANIGDAVLTVLVSIEGNAILVLDPETYETVAIKKTNVLQRRGRQRNPRSENRVWNLCTGTLRSSAGKMKNPEKEEKCKISL